jgi:protein gp37
MSLNRTGIETADFTWNLYTGCLHGCSFCYARKLARGRLNHVYSANKCVSSVISPGVHPGDPFFPRFWADRKGDPHTVPENFQSKNPTLKRGKALIFAIDMGDIFGPFIPDRWVQDLMGIIEGCPQTFQILTKFPGRLMKWAESYGLPHNVWAGVTVCNQLMVEPALECLCRIDAAVKYLCVEPLQERINLDLTGVDWVIIGAQTNPLILPETAWVQELLEEARACNTHVFLKKSLRWSDKVHQWPGGVYD